MSSIAQVTANQENATLSTGPTSAAGKAVSSQNALKHGFYRPVPVDDPERTEIANSYHREFQPVTSVEHSLVEALASTFRQICQIDRAEPIFVRNHAAAKSMSYDEAFVDLLCQPKNNTLKLMYQRRSQAQNQWNKALKEIQRLRKLRASHPIGFVPSDMERTCPPGPVCNHAGVEFSGVPHLGDAPSNEDV